MKKLCFLTILLLLKGSLLFSQVAISTDGSAPHASAVLDLQSANQGLLLPRVTTTQQKNIDEPASGLVIYNLDSNDIYFYNGLYWLSVRNLTDTIQKWNCGDSLIDIRDSQVYGTVQIGTQCWMKENLNIGTRINGGQEQTDNSVIEKYCYDDLESNCVIYGGLYQWDEMMQYTTQEGTQGLCPDGWHVPSDAEWTALTNWQSSTNTCAVGNILTVNNATGFSGLPGGGRYLNGYFFSVGYAGYWWTSTEYFDFDAWYRYLNYGHPEVGRDYYGKGNGFSVRCLRDL